VIKKILRTKGECNMDDFAGVIIGIIVVVAIVALIVYIIALIAMAIATVAAIGGSVWGGGWAILNYCRSIKENLIDSNRTPVTV